MQQWQVLVQRLMDEKQWNQYDLADATGYAQSNINRLLKTTQLPSRKAVQRLSNAFGVPESYFLSNVFKTDSIPLLEWSEVNDWLHHQQKEAHNTWIPTITMTGPRTYALKVTSSDMVGESKQHMYPVGATIVVDPDVPRQTGSRIAVQLPDLRFLFRELREAGGEYFLSPLDSSFPPISLGSAFNATYLGTVKHTIITE